MSHCRSTIHERCHCIKPLYCRKVQNKGIHLSRIQVGPCPANISESELHLNQQDYPGRFQIRQANRRDARGLAIYAQALFEERLETMFLHNTAPDEKEQEDFIAGFDRENAHLLVAECDDQIIGMAGFKGHGRPQLRHSGIIGFGVARTFRGNGIGHALLAGLVEWARSDPLLSRIECDVFSTNEAALGLLEKCGFTREGTMRSAIQVGDRKIDNHLMALVW